MPENTLPQEAKFFVADDIRSDGMSSKPTLFGLYPDDVIVLHFQEGEPDPSKEQPALVEGIAILSAFDMAYGVFKAEISLHQPDGEPIFNSVDEIRADNLGPMLVVMKFQPFSISQIGRYKFSVTLNDKMFEYYFEVRRVSLPSPVQPTAA